MHCGALCRVNVHEEEISRPETLQALAALRDLPDWAVLDEEQTSAATTLSKDSLKRLDARGEGIPRTKLSERRFGRTVGNVKQWLQQRSSK